MANTIGWWIVDSNVEELMIDHSLKHTLKKVKKIRRRTKALNIELKKYAGLKQYKQYVTIKTEILRNITDNEDTDDEPCVRSAIAADSFILSGVESQDEETAVSHKVKHNNRHNAKKELSTCNSREENGEEEHTEIKREKKLIRKSSTNHNGSNKSSKCKEQELVEVQQLENNERPRRKSNRHKAANELLKSKDKDQEDDEQPNKNENRLQENYERLQEKADKHATTNGLPESECDDEVKQQQLRSDKSLPKKGDKRNAINGFVECVYAEEMDEQEPENDERLREEEEENDENEVTNGLSKCDDEEEMEEEEPEIVEKLSENDDTHDATNGISERDDEEEQEEDQEDLNHGKIQENGELLMESESEEEAKVHQPDVDVAIQKKSQPTIKCTEIVTSKYTIVQDKNKKDRSIDKSCEISEVPSDAECKANGLLPDESCEISQLPPDESRGASHRPIDENSLDDDDEVVELEKQTHEARRVGQLKRLNLLYDNSESDSSESADDVSPAEKRCNPVKPPALSQVINDSSDSDESQPSQGDVSKKMTVDRPKTNKLSSRASPPLHISDCESDIVKNNARKEADEVAKTKSAPKSLKSQIDEQDSNDETIATRNETRPAAAPTSTAVPSEAESLRYILKNISSTGNKDSTEPDYMHFPSGRVECSTLATSTKAAQSQMEVLSRPIELNEFIEREELVPIHQLSTVNMKNFKSWNEEDGDEEILLMEIPKSIVIDGQLSGKRIVIKREKLKIDDVCYKTIRRRDESLSCILSAGKKGTRFKTAMMRPVRSIVVCQESSETSFLSTSFKTQIYQSTPLAAPAARRDAGHVPFPHNLKSRNPLMALNERSNDRSKPDSPARRHSSAESEEGSVRTKKHKSTHSGASESRDDEAIPSNGGDKKRRKTLPLDTADASKDRSSAKRKRSRNETRESVLWQLDDFAS